MPRCVLISIVILAAVLTSGVPVRADDAPCRLVDTPTAGLPGTRGVLLESRLFDGGGFTGRALAGVTRFLAVGVSYGGGEILGAEHAAWQPHAGIQARVRLVEETTVYPALAFGYDSQGEGVYLRGKDLGRFRTKSRGLYLVASRNYRFLGDLGFHAGGSWSPETSDGDSDPTFWAGLDKSVGKLAEVRCEYDIAANDDDTGRMTADRGLLNIAIAIRAGGPFTLEIALRNMMRRDLPGPGGVRIDRPQPSREVGFSWRGAF